MFNMFKRQKKTIIDEILNKIKIPHTDIYGGSSNEYLNQKLADGITIREHMKSDYEKAMYLGSEQAKMDFPTDINAQLNFVIKNMEIKNNKYIGLNDNEKTIIKTYLQKLSQKVHKKYYISLTRLYDGTVRVYYDGCQICQFRIIKEPTLVQYSKNLQDLKQVDNITLQQCLDTIDYWVKYSNSLNRI